MNETPERPAPTVRPGPLAEHPALLPLVAEAGGVGVLIWPGEDAPGQASPQLVTIAAPWGSLEAWWLAVSTRLERPAPTPCRLCGRDEHRGETEITTTVDGEQRALRLSFAGHLHEQAAIPGAELWLVRDITDVRHIEERLTHAEAGAVSTIEQLLSNISHELRTPLTAIVGMTELAMDTALTPQQAEYLHTIGNSAEVLLHLVYQVLDLTKVEARRVAIEKIPFDPRRLIAGVLELARRRAEGKGLDLSAEVDEGVPQTLRGDPHRLRQILVNLVSNGITYTETGGVVVTATAEPEGDGAVALRFAVQDTGPGIAPELHDRVFERFYQVDGRTNRRSGGAGLGLAIARGLAGLMDARLWLDSQPGAGSTFHMELRLPVVDTSEAVPAKPLPAPGPANTVVPPRVLVVEDNPDNRNLITWILEDAGATVDTAENGERGVDRTLTGSYDLVLMDVQMPVMDGFEAAERIRREERERGGLRVPIVALTAHATQGFRERCLAAGMDFYVTKPTTRARLLEVVEHWADRRPRVLVVDLDPARRHATAQALRAVRDDLRVVQAAGPREALRVLAELHLDLVLLDSAAAGPDAASLLGVVRELSGQRTTPVAVLADRGTTIPDAATAEVSLLHRPVGETDLRGLLAALPDAPSGASPPSSEPASGDDDTTIVTGPGAPIIVRPDPDLADLVPAFMEQRRREAEALEDLVERSDLDALRRLGHNLKGSGAPYGFDGLSRLGGELEHAAKSGDMDAVRRIATALADYVQRVEIVL